jgi:hypothetical protein
VIRSIPTKLAARFIAFWHSRTRNTFASLGSPDRSALIRANSDGAWPTIGTLRTSLFFVAPIGSTDHHDPVIEVQIAPFDFPGFTETASSESEALYEVSTVP